MNLRTNYPPKLKIDDTVRIVNQKQITFNREGKITEINEVEKSNQLQYKLSFDNEWVGYYVRSDLEKI